MSNTPIPYPTEPRAALDSNAQLLILYGQPKVGKTACVAALPGCLVLVLRGGSADHLSGNIMDIPRLCEAGKYGTYKADWPEEKRNEFFCDAYLRTLDDLSRQRAEGYPIAQYVAHDDLSIIEDWVFDLALRTFKGTLMGKQMGDSVKRVTDLPGQAGSPGWAYVWEEFDRMLWRIRQASPRAIILAHIKDKQVNKETGQVTDTDIDLSGKMRKIALREASATGHLYREANGDLIANFESTSGINVGAWCKHLVGQKVVLGRVPDPKTRETIFDWSKLYVKEETK